MFNDARISTALEAMVQGIHVPPVPLHDIQRKVSQATASQRSTSPYLRVAIGTAAAIGVAVVALPSISPALVQSIEDRYAAALRAMGGQVPPPVPKSVDTAISSQEATLATAQSRVPFTIVPPAGLPKDIVSAKISTSQTGVYSKSTHSWQVGSQDVTFFYDRAHGRSFVMIADRFDPQSEAPPKYMFEPKDDLPATNARVTLVKHERFTWRNGNQVMTVTEGDGISSQEIMVIRDAMHGIPIPGAVGRAPRPGTSLKFYRITKP